MNYEFDIDSCLFASITDNITSDIDDIIYSVSDIEIHLKHLNSLLGNDKSCTINLDFVNDFKESIEALDNEINMILGAGYHLLPDT